MDMHGMPACISVHFFTWIGAYCLGLTYLGCNMVCPDEFVVMQTLVFDADRQTKIGKPQSCGRLSVWLQQCCLIV